MIFAIIGRYYWRHEQIRLKMAFAAKRNRLLSLSAHEKKATKKGDGRNYDGGKRGRKKLKKGTEAIAMVENLRMAIGTAG